jgi:predicted nucleic acid-binding protein
MDDWVFVDTCVWASFFTKPNSAEKIAVAQLLSADRIALAGPIVSEVLIGFQRKNQADWIASRLKLAHYVEATWSDWQVAADLGRGLASKGQRLPLSDLVIGAIAKRLSAFVYTTDPHFDLIADLKRFRP